MTRRKEAPLDPFKRAVTLTTRSIAADSAMEVVFTSEPPGLTGKMARLPEPSRVPTKSEIAVIRGHADAAALSVACHNPVLHAALAPQRDVADILALGGGVPIQIGNETIGGVGSSGSSQEMDDACAKAGIAKVADLLK